MSRPAFTLERVDESHATISWTGKESGVVRIYRDGLIFFGPYTDTSAKKSAVVPWDISEPVAYEVTEENADGSQSVDGLEVDLKPTIKWSDEPEAWVFRVYHKELPSGASEILSEVVPDRSQQLQQHELASELNGVGGVWHELRVEAVTEDWGVSSRAAWRALMRDHRKGPALIGVTAQGGGLFTITVTE